MPERQDPSEQSSAEGEAAGTSADDGEAAYSEDEEAAVAARLEDLGYI
jgi:hypothetical protein